jgi:hypothetical protein
MHECWRVKTGTNYEIELLDGKWTLRQQCIADEQCVADEQADYVGEIMFSSVVFINFCPFCGERLNPDSEVSESGLHKNTIPFNKYDPQTFYQCLALQQYNIQHPEFGSSRDKHGYWFVTPDYQGRGIWHLRRYAPATEQMVQSGRVEKVGELVFKYGFDILYCPFCGEPLDAHRIEAFHLRAT